MSSMDSETATRTICPHIAYYGRCGDTTGTHAHSKPCASRYSHTIMDVARLNALVDVANPSRVSRELVLEYIAGRDVFGVPACNSSGWRLVLTERNNAGHGAAATRTITVEDFLINVATKNLEDKVAAAGMINSPRMARRGDTYRTLCRNNRDGLCPNGSRCPNDHSLIETMRMQRIASNTHHRAAIVYVSIKYVNRDSWQVVAKVRARQGETDPFSVPTMLPVPLFAADQSLDRALRKIESKMARRDALALGRTIPAQVPSENPPPYSAVQAQAPTDEYYGTSTVSSSISVATQHARVSVVIQPTDTPTMPSPAYTMPSASSPVTNYRESPFQREREPLVHSSNLSTRFTNYGTTSQQQAVGEHVSEFFGYLVCFASLAAIMGFFIWAIYNYGVWIVLGCVLAVQMLASAIVEYGFKETVAFLLVFGSFAWALYNMEFTGSLSV
ncbi:uncharacterized protein LAESUDRAFT_809226 [Laetiporus sulphureus 93-53]|uniref:C3H1-type domain-containing protein n=1 Tax=Laetiporus sulphureus 93-53 TaxID=1314785 RepID=A0A165H516_9APHY|nr:uncharacterized protein LAESUDRAFT_809226 [Laetiporus sulphureus 93-53]KZT11253.1 hypothetical protein LAESUDRAFT_809226 [Laetiporus sulphureus 93-53]